MANAEIEEIKGHLLALEMALFHLVAMVRHAQKSPQEWLGEYKRRIQIEVAAMRRDPSLGVSATSEALIKIDELLTSLEMGEAADITLHAAHKPDRQN